MKKMIKFPSIEQFRTVVTNVIDISITLVWMKMVMQYMMLPFQNQNLPLKYCQIWNKCGSLL
jgi:hypothetical protein